MVNVPTGGRKKKFNASIATTDAMMAIRKRARVAVPRTTSKSDKATVVGLTPENVQSTAVTAARAATLQRRAIRSRVGTDNRMGRCPNSDTCNGRPQALDGPLTESLRLSYASLRYGGLTGARPMETVSAYAASGASRERISAILADYLALERAHTLRRLLIVRSTLLALLAAIVGHIVPGPSTLVRWAMPALCCVPPAWAWVRELRLEYRLVNRLEDSTRDHQNLNFSLAQTDNNFVESREGP